MRKNEYANALPDYDRTPKAVYAAVALSLATQVGQCAEFSEAHALILEEWRILHGNGIVPQCPPRTSR